MCGIAGIISPDPSAITTDRLRKMTDAIAHRGPDGEGSWINVTGNAGLASRRLSIIDLSAAASQPMHFLNRYSIVHNGEIYNHIELKEELEKKGYRFYSRSDTEVILAAYEQYGEGCLEYFNGMFAFAIWDEKEQTLFCARDRFGEKPFYYFFDDRQFIFGSERKAIWAAGVEKKINNPLLLNYLAIGLSSTAADSTITFHQDIFSLPPAHFLKLHAPSFTFTITRYWDADKETRSTMNEKQAAEKLKEILYASIRMRLRSDVTTGALLSGGLDSSCVVAGIHRAQDPRPPLNSFSAVFPGYEKDESQYIRMVAEKFSLSAHSVTPTAADCIRDFEKLCFHQEEPFSSSSVYAQYRVFELAAAQNVKVLLDGQGADEILAGYPRFIPWYLQEILRSSPRQLRSERRAFRKNNYSFSWGLSNYAAAFFPMQVPGHLQKKEAKKILGQPDITSEFKRQFFDRQSIYKPLVIRLNDMLYFSTCQFGLEELLRVADRNSMAHGREARMPYLDHELVQFVAALPAVFKMHSGWTKWILRKSAENELPREIVWRRDKVAFEPPQKSWMETGIMKEYTRAAKQKLVLGKILNPAVLDKKNQPRDTHAADNFDWRFLVAAAFL